MEIRKSLSSKDHVFLKVLSFNVWGILKFYNDYYIRMKEISKKLAEGDFDVICLQEVWNEQDFELFRQESKTVYPYSNYFYSGVFGSGVCIFSKWPIMEILFHQWQVNGYMHKVFHCDWYGGKGVGLCKLNVDGFVVNVFTSHLHAQYNDRNDEYLAHRVVQAYDTAQFIRTTSNDADLTILAGDLNADSNEICYDVIQQYAILNDSFKKESVDFVGTFCSARNSYANSKKVITSPQGQRLDYILYKSGKNVQAECMHYGNPFEPRIPGKSFSYSDHEAITATFKISRVLDIDGDIEKFDLYNHEQLKQTFLKCSKIFEDALNELKKNATKYTINAVSSLLLLITFWLAIVFYFSQNLQANLIIIIISSFLCFLLVMVFLFCVLMACLWNRIECCGIISSFNGMKIYLNNQIELSDE